MRRVLLVATLIGLSGASAFTQGSGRKIPIDVRHSGTDRVGIMLAADVKDQIARSARYSIGTGSLAAISLASLEVDRHQNRAGLASAVSVLFKTPLVCKSKDGGQYSEVRAAHVLYVVGRDKTVTISKEILAEYAAYRDKQHCDE
jgi:hypothetical protein